MEYKQNFLSVRQTLIFSNFLEDLYSIWYWIWWSIQLKNFTAIGMHWTCWIICWNNQCIWLPAGCKDCFSVANVLQVTYLTTIMTKENLSKTDIDFIRSGNKCSTCNIVDIQNDFNLFELPILAKKVETNVC